MATVLLVVATAVLITFSLYTFMTEKNNIAENFYDIGYVEALYADNARIQLYFENVADASALEAYNVNGKIDNNFQNLFLEKFKENIVEVPRGNYYGQINTKIDEKSYTLKKENDMFTFTLNGFGFVDSYGYDKEGFTLNDYS